MKIGILGTGRMAAHMVHGWVGAGIDPLSITISPRGRAMSQKLAREVGVIRAESNADAIVDADVVILAVPPEDAERVLGGLSFRAAQRVVSVCAGVSLGTLAPLARPADVALAMPTTAVSVGTGAIPVYNADEKVDEILSVLGATIPVADEEEYRIATVSVAVYGWCLELIGRSAAWSFRAGLPPETARVLAAETFSAAGRMVADTPERLVHEIAKEVASDGTIAALGLEQLSRAGAWSAWAAAHKAVDARLKDGAVEKADLLV